MVIVMNKCRVSPSRPPFIKVPHTLTFLQSCRVGGMGRRETPKAPEMSLMSHENGGREVTMGACMRMCHVPLEGSSRPSGIVFLWTAAGQPPSSLYQPSAPSPAPVPSPAPLELPLGNQKNDTELSPLTAPLTALLPLRSTRLAYQRG